MYDFEQGKEYTLANMQTILERIAVPLNRFVFSSCSDCIVYNCSNSPSEIISYLLGNNITVLEYSK